MMRLLSLADSRSEHWPLSSTTGLAEPLAVGRRAAAAVTIAALSVMMIMATATARAGSVNDANITVTAFATGFSSPTALRFVPGSVSQYFVVEKNTGLVRFSNAGKVTMALDLAVANDSERGFLVWS